MTNKVNYGTMNFNDILQPINLIVILYTLSNLLERWFHKWRLPNQSELTPMIFNTGLTHLGSKASKSLMK